jgi:serine/threonine protein phosphatase PrpC
VPHEVIRDSLTSAGSPAETANHLVTLANGHGGPDNTTVIVIDVMEASRD